MSLAKQVLGMKIECGLAVLWDDAMPFRMKMHWKIKWSSEYTFQNYDT